MLKFLKSLFRKTPIDYEFELPHKEHHRVNPVVTGGWKQTLKAAGFEYQSMRFPVEDPFDETEWIRHGWIRYASEEEDAKGYCINHYRRKIK